MGLVTALVMALLTTSIASLSSSTHWQTVYHQAASLIAAVIPRM